MTKMLSTKEVAEKLEVGINRARAIINRVDFPKVIVGPRKNLIPEDSLDEWIFYNNTEVWRPLKYGDIDLTDKYEVSSTGKLRSIKTGRILKQTQNKRGYMTVCIRIGSEYKLIKMHRAVAYTFVKNYSNRPFVNHLDGDKTNNHVNNLQWCTHEENMEHAIRTGLFKPGTYRKRSKNI